MQNDDKVMQNNLMSPHRPPTDLKSGVDANGHDAWEAGATEADMSYHRIGLALANKRQNQSGAKPPEDQDLKTDIEPLASFITSYDIPHDVIQRAIWLGVGDVFRHIRRGTGSHRSPDGSCRWCGAVRHRRC